MENPIISIIIPHYNTPVLLKRCLKSIPETPLFQTIVVDDNSDKNIQNNLQEVCNTFNNVSLIKLKKNIGGGGARNAALKVAKGKFLLFADADDFFTPYIYNIINKYKDTKFDIVFFKANCVDSDTYEIKNRTNHLNNYIELWKKDPIKAEKYLRFMFGEPWCKLIRKSIVDNNSITFDETKKNNDTKFSYLCGYFAQKITIDNCFLYTYTVGRKSVSRQISIEAKLSSLYVFGKSELFFRLHNIDLKENRQYIALYSILRDKDIDNFIYGIEELKKMGYKKFEIYKDFSITVSLNSILSPIWCIIYSPSIIIKFLCLFFFLFLTIPRFICFNILKIKSNEIKRW